jgi:DNA polymerase-4
MGLSSISALASAPETLLSERFGSRLGRALHRRACFHHDDEVAPARKVVSESRERTFDHDIADPARLEAILERMAGELCASLAKHGRRGRTVAIKVRLDDFSTVTRARTLPEATREPVRVGRVAVELLRKYAPPRPVRLLGVRVAGFDLPAQAASVATEAGRPGATPQQAAQLALRLSSR